MSSSLDLTRRTAIGTVRRLLTDTSRCPACVAMLRGNRCSACGLDLSGPAAGELLDLSLRADRLLADRETVLDAMRDRARTAARPQPGPTPGAGPAAAAPSSPRSGPGPAPMRAPAPAPAGPMAGTPTPVRRGPGVHGLLVGLGALLLAVAAVGFLIFSWPAMSLPGRAAVIAVATFAVLSIAAELRPRLPETAEAIGGLGVVLVLADGWAVRRTGLLGADRPEIAGYLAGAAAVCALLLAGWGLIARIRAGTVAAVALTPLAVLLLAVRLDGELLGLPGLGVGGLLAAAVALARVRLPAGWTAERWVLRAVAGAALITTVGPAIVGRPGPARAALLLAAVSVAALAQAVADRRQPGPIRTMVTPAWSLFLRRAWSLAAGLSAGTAALQAGRLIEVRIGVHGVWTLPVVLALPALTVVATAVIRTRPGAPIRRVAFAAGTAAVALLTALPILLLAGWLPIRVVVAAAEPWNAQAGSRFSLLHPVTGAGTSEWLVALTGLVLLSAVALSGARIGDWPGWLRRPTRLLGAAAAIVAAVVLALVPAAPVWGVVTGLLLTAIITAVTAAVPAPGRPRLLTGAGWIVSAGSGTLAVLLAWTTLDLAAPLTLAGIAALLLARRRIGGRIGSRIASAGLAALAATAGPFTAAAGAAAAGAPMPLRWFWFGLAGGLSAAALIAVPRWLPRAGDRRAPWNGVDRVAAAVPGLLALLVALPADGTTNGGPRWTLPGLLAVALLLAVGAAGASRPQVARVLPGIPVGGAALAGPLLGLLAVSISVSLRSAAPAALLWAAAAGVGAFVLTGLVLAGRAEPARRRAAEVGLVLTGLIALTLASDHDRLWAVLLVLAAAAAAIASAPDRRQLGWLAAVLSIASSWARLTHFGVSTVEAYSLPPAAMLLALACFRLRRDRSTDPAVALRPAAALGFAPSVLAAAGGGSLRPALLIATAAVFVLGAHELERREAGRPEVDPGEADRGGADLREAGRGESVGVSAGRPRLGVLLTGLAVLVAAATAVLRSAAAVLDAAHNARPSLPLTSVELWAGSAAIVLLLAGSGLMSKYHPAAGRSDGPAASWPAYAPGVLLLLLPSLLVDLSEPDGPALRPAILIVLAGATLGVGVLARLQAPVVLGAAVVSIQALVLLAPQISSLAAGIPLWGWLGAVGLGLLVLGAGYERRLRQLRSIRIRLGALR